MSLRSWWLNVRSVLTRCHSCRGTGVFQDREIIPRSELSPMEQAELMVNGGYAYRLVPKPCPYCTTEESA